MYLSIMLLQFLNCMSAIEDMLGCNGQVEAAL